MPDTPATCLCSCPHADHQIDDAGNAHGSLFSGYGGLDMAACNVFDAKLAFVSDIKPAACKLLAHRHPDVPNLGDITAVDWSQIEPVDIITGGFPCTDISTAGKRAGLIRTGDDKTRSGLWSEMHRAIDTLRPSWVVAENVRAITSAKADSDVEPCPWCVGDDDTEPLRALGAVLADLADIGYDAAWCGLRASDVGAPHARYRIFILAWPTAQDADDATRGERRDAAPGQAEGGRSRANTGRRGGTSAANTEGIRQGEGRPESAGQLGRPDHVVGGAPAPADAHCEHVRVESVGQPWRGGEAVTELGGETAADAVGGGRNGRAPVQVGRPVERTPAAGSGETDWGTYTPAIERWERIRGSAPSPTEAGPRGGQRLSPALPEWMMGVDNGWITDVPGLSRSDMLSLAGDGVVPQQADAAIRWLLCRVAEALGVAA